MISHEVKESLGNREAIWLPGGAGWPTTMSASLLLSPYKIPCKPATLGMQATQRSHSKFEIPSKNSKLEFSLFE
jgi:hypothetical protein